MQGEEIEFFRQGVAVRLAGAYLGIPQALGESHHKGEEAMKDPETVESSPGFFLGKLTGEFNALKEDVKGLKRGQWALVALVLGSPWLPSIFGAG